MLKLRGFAILAVLFVVGSSAPAPVIGAEELPPLYELEDTVRVVGERLPNDPLRLPMAVTIVPGAVLRETRPFGLDRALEFVPGAVGQVRSGGQDVRISIRGFGSRGAGDRSNSGTTRGIRILLDGFPLTEPDGRTSLDLAELGGLSRIQVVRSNASALFGSASGGLIQLVSRASFDQPFVDLRTQGGSCGLRGIQGSGGLLAGGMRAHLSASDARFEGWRRHSENRRLTVLGSVQLEPSAGNYLAIYASGSHSYFQQPGALTWEEFRGDPRAADSAYVARNDRRNNRVGRLAVRFRHGEDEGESVQAGGFLEPKVLRRSERNRYRDFQRLHAGGDLVYTRAISLPAERRGHLNLGAEFASQDGSALFYNLGPGGIRGDELLANKREAITTGGTFAECDLSPGGPWQVVAGLRQDWIRYLYEDYQKQALKARKTLSRTSPRLTLAWRGDEGPEGTADGVRVVYVSLFGGLEAPAFNETDPPAPFDTLTGLNPFLRPARSLTYELGVKGGLSQAKHFRLHWDAALYNIELHDDIIPYDGGAYYLMAGRSRRQGIELGGHAETDIGLEAQIALSFSRNRYLDYENDLGRFDDNESAGIPSRTASASLRYQTPWLLYLEGSVRHLGAYFADDANTARVPRYTVADAGAGIEIRQWGRRLSLFLDVNNVTDERYVSSVYINGVGGRYYEPGLPRNVVIGLRVLQQRMS